MFKNKFPCAIAVLSFVLIVATFHIGNIKAQSVTYPANSIWVDPGTFVFNKVNGSIGTMFNLTAWASTNDSSYTWEVGIHFNASLFQATAAGLTAGGTSAFFVGHTTVPIGPMIDNATGEVLFGESLLGSDSVAAGNGSLMWTTFEITGVPNSTSTALGNFWIDGMSNNASESYVLNYDLNEMNLTGRFGATYSFTYLGDTIPPTIGNLTQVPVNVTEGQNVTVSVNVTDEPGGSGVASVILSYSTNNVTFTNETMKLNPYTRLYDGVIPGYQAGETVYYLIYASDNGGNAAVPSSNSGNWNYAVLVPEFPSALLLMLPFAMATAILLLSRKIKH